MYDGRWDALSLGTAKVSQNFSHLHFSFFKVKGICARHYRPSTTLTSFIPCTLLLSMKNNDVGTPEIPHRASIYYYRVLKKALMSTVKFYETRCSLSVNMEIVQMRIPRGTGSQIDCRYWVHFAHRLQCTVTLNSNFAILKPEIVFN